MKDHSIYKWPKLHHQKLYIFLLLFSIFHFTLKAQKEATEEQFKVAFTYHFLSNVNWENGLQENRFTMGVLTNNSELAKTFQVLNNLEMHGKTVRIRYFTNFTNIADKNLQALFVGEDYKMSIAAIRKILENKHTLVISDGAADSKSIMINLVKKEDKLNFEINSGNLKKENLSIKDELLLLGGTDVDVRGLYEASQAKLEEEQKKVEQQQKELDEKEEKIKEHQKTLEAQQEELTKQQQAIAKQEGLISDQQKAITQQKDAIKRQQDNLKELLANVDEQSQKLAQKEKEMAFQDQQLQKQVQELEKGKGEIQQQNKRIAEQKESMTLQLDQIDFQKNLIYIAIVLLLIFGVLVYFIYKGLVVQKQAKLELLKNKEEMEAQNEELRQQQEEILSINETLSSQKDSLASQHEAITQSINYAKTIQYAVLPAEAQLMKNLSNYFLVFKPKDIVSGDFYFTGRKDNKKIIVVADCTGHGVPGAFMSLLGINILNNIIDGERVVDPAKILNLLQRKIRMRLRQSSSQNDDGMDLGICQIEEKANGEKHLLFSGAKNRLYHVHHQTGEVTLYNSDRIQIGGVNGHNSNNKFSNASITIAPKDMIYMATDGFQDQCNMKRRKFSSRRLQENFQQIHSLKLEEQKSILETALTEYQGESLQRDDITLLGFRI